eukprot:11223403-Lingulodinium_polyedra.AAC.1
MSCTDSGLGWPRVGFNVPATPKNKRTLANPLGADLGVCNHDARGRSTSATNRQTWDGRKNAGRGPPAHSTVGARPVRLAL